MQNPDKTAGLVRAVAGIDVAITARHHVAVREVFDDGTEHLSRFTVDPTLAGRGRPFQRWVGLSAFSPVRGESDAVTGWQGGCRAKERRTVGPTAAGPVPYSCSRLLSPSAPKNTPDAGPAQQQVRHSLLKRNPKR